MIIIVWTNKSSRDEANYAIDYFSAILSFDITKCCASDRHNHTHRNFLRSCFCLHVSTAQGKFYVYKLSDKISSPKQASTHIVRFASH